MTNRTILKELLTFEESYRIMNLEETNRQRNVRDLIRDLTKVNLILSFCIIETTGKYD